MLKISTQNRLKKIIKIAIPSGINSLLDIVVIAVNIFFMSMISDSHTLAMGLALNFLMLFYAVNAVFSVGTNVQISHYFGAKEYQKIHYVFSSIVQGSFVISAPLVLVGIYGAGFFFNWIGVDGEVKNLALVFNDFIIFTLPALILKNIFTAALAGIGNTVYPLFVRLASMVFSILLTYIFVFIYHLGIKGAGIAYLIVGYLELCIFILIFLIKKDLFSFGLFEKQYLFNMFKIGIPAGFERLLSLFSLIFTTKIIATYNDWVLTGSQIGSRIEAFSFMPSFGFMLAAMVLMGQSLGAKKIREAEIYTLTILKFSSLLMGITGILLVVFARYLSSLFSSNEEVISSSVYYLIAVGISQIPLIWSFVLDGALRGAGKTKLVLLINAISIWCFRIFPMIVLAYFDFGFIWIYTMICIETYIRALIFWRVFKKGAWKNTKRDI